MKVKQYIFVLILMLVLASCSGNETDIATDNKESISLHNGSNNESTTDETITYMSEENDDELDFVSDTLLCFGVGFGVRHLVVFRVRHFVVRHFVVDFCYMEELI